MGSSIGIFDSGIGGMTVAKTIRKQLPNESITYFGDTAHLPYGDKSAESIRHYAARITSWLVQSKVKMVVIACNTASSYAYDTVKDICGPKIPVINVIDPVVNHVASSFAIAKKIGIIGTKGTVDSRVYPKRIQRLNPGLKIISQATPLLAPMIEEGFFNNSISKTVIASYLDKKSFQNIDAIVLGCTHYPLIHKEIAQHYNNKVEVIDSAKIVAKAVKETIDGLGIAAEPGEQPIYSFSVSDYGIDHFLNQLLYSL
ncbi:MAG: glutamate racemase [Flavobacteriales bacterium]|nr:glutamate racemase [Flavobacteriales bacterium]